PRESRAARLHKRREEADVLPSVRVAPRRAHADHPHPSHATRSAPQVPQRSLPTRNLKVGTNATHTTWTQNHKRSSTNPLRWTRLRCFRGRSSSSVLVALTFRESRKRSSLPFSKTKTLRRDLTTT